jgi:uncharacterized membrane protein YhaH (DUF805 family)
MNLILKPEKCFPSLQLEVQPAADMSFNGITCLLWFEDILTLITDFLSVLILPLLAGIIFILNIFLFKSFEIRKDGLKNKGKQIL